MDSNKKNQFDAILSLWKGAREHFYERRKFEFQISLALWTALASFTALVFSKEIDTSKFGWCRHLLILLCFGLFPLVHWLWLRGISKANRIDKKIEFHYEKKLQIVSDSSFESDLLDEITAYNEEEKGVFFWSHSTKIIFTVILSTTAILSIYHSR